MMNSRLAAALAAPDPEIVAREEEEFCKLQEEMAKAKSERNQELKFPDPPAMVELKESSWEGSDMVERCKYIPLRLSYEERKSLRLVNSAINVCDYTSRTDSCRSQAKRRHFQLLNIYSFLSGLVCADSYDEGQKAVTNKSFQEYEDEIRRILEIARRYKIMNPEKMRADYGKLMYLMQDACSPEIIDILGINIYSPIKTVHTLLESKGCLDLLKHKSIRDATMEVLPDKSKSRNYIQAEIAKKERAVDVMVSTFARRGSAAVLSEADVLLCLHSICDNNSFLNSNRLPIDVMIGLLKENFDRNHTTTSSSSNSRRGRSNNSSKMMEMDDNLDDDDDDSSLQISTGSAGARLSHAHSLQYDYVLQSLTLWREIIGDMFRLWYLSESDLLDAVIRADGHEYELVDTGQGWQRVQQSPQAYRAMHEILYSTQRRLRSDSGNNWIGSSVIHLGDRNVPNALVFIDKYTQVARILGPIVSCINHLYSIESANDADAKRVQKLIAKYGGVNVIIKSILKDFFTHGFDGSGKIYYDSHDDDDE